MINLKLETSDVGGLQRWLVTAPAGFASALREATRKATPLLGGAIRSATPIRKGRPPGGHPPPPPGGLLASISNDVRDTATGATGRVVTHIRYARYVEFGTRQHGGPQRYFLRGSAESKPEVEAIFDYEVRRMADTFGN